MEACYGNAQRIWVMDRGMTSAENLASLKQTGRHYAIGTSRGEIQQWSRPIAQARDGVEAELRSEPHGTETFLLCRSVERRKREQAMRERFVARIENGLAKLAPRIGRFRRLIGRLLERKTRAAGRDRVHLH